MQPNRERTAANAERAGRRVWGSAAFLVFLLVADVVELALSVLLAALSPTPEVRAPLAVPAFEAPARAPEWSLGAGALGVALGVWIAVTLVVELVWVLRLARLRRAAAYRS